MHDQASRVRSIGHIGRLAISGRRGVFRLGSTSLRVRLVCATLFAVTASGLVAPQASAATLSAQRETLRQVQYAAADDYKASRESIPQLPRANGLEVKGAIAAGLASLEVVGDQLTAATTQMAMDSVAMKMKAEALRAATVKRSGQQLVVLKDLRLEHQTIVTKALANHRAGRITGTEYRGTSARARAFSTQWSADVARQLGALGRSVESPDLLSRSYITRLNSNSGVIPTVQGWVGFPGGCALPSAASNFKPVLPADGPGVATTRQLASKPAVSAASDPAMKVVHGQLLRAAANESKRVLTLGQLRAAYVVRVPRLGYGWLSGGDTKARAVLASDAKKILEAGPNNMTTLASSHLLMAASTAADWVKLRGLDDVALVRWLGPQTCLLADRDSFVKSPTNLAAIHNAANFIAAAVFLKNWPEQAAALAKESLVSVQPALRMITTDGGTQEGPGYWTYQSRAIAVLYATMRNAYTSRPLAMPSLSKVSAYAMNSTGPNGRPTPFGDSLPNELSALMPAWDAYVRKDQSVAAWVMGRFAQKPNAYLMWWRIPQGPLPAKRSAVYPHTGLAVLQLPGSTATLKGGANELPHSHRDLGTISFFRRGIQWAVDPGTMPNTTPGYYSALQRLKYWKPGTSAHSTLSLTGDNQPAGSHAEVKRVTSSTASVDLRQALPGTDTATRTITHGTTSLVIKDVIRASVGKDMTWRWITDAAVSLGKNRAVLRRDGRSITVTFTGVPPGSTLAATQAPDVGPDGKVLTILKLTMPKVTTLNLTVKAF